MGEGENLQDSAGVRRGMGAGNWRIKGSALLDAGSPERMHNLLSPAGNSGLHPTGHKKPL